MMRLLTGPPGSGKTARVLHEFREAFQVREGNPRLLTPTATLEHHLRNELARNGVVVRPSKISTLHRFAEELAPDRPLVSAPIFQLICQDAAATLNLPEFRAIENLPGFASALAATIEELDGAGCRPSDLEGLKQAGAPFAKALAAIWSETERQLDARRLWTRAGLLRALTREMNRLPAPDRIWLDGFIALSSPETDFLRALSQRSAITLTLPDGPSRKTREALLALGCEEERLSGSDRKPREIVTVPETMNREAEEIARHINQCIAGGMPAHEIGVIVRNPASYQPVLRAAFERFGIPAVFHFSQPLRETQAGLFFCGVIEALLNGWEHEQTLAVLRTIPAIGASEALDRLELKLRPKLPGCGLQSLKTWARENRPLARVLRTLEQIEAWRHNPCSPREWAERVTSLSAVFRPTIVEDGARRSEFHASRAQASGIHAFGRALEVAAGWWQESTASVSLDKWWPIAESVVRSTATNSEGHARNQVHVLDAYEARQWDFSVAFVCGLVEKEFPRQHTRNPFLPDAALRALQAKGIDVRTAEDHEAQEASLFESARSRARSLLVLSYPRTDARGQRYLASAFLSGCKAVPQDAPVVRPTTPLPIAQWREPARLVSAPLLQILTEKHTKVAVSALESLLQCPFQFFSAKTLGLREAPLRPEDRMDARLAGEIAHLVLNRWFAARPSIEPLFNAIWTQVCERENVRPGFRTELKRRELLRTLRRFTQSEDYPLRWSALTEQQFELPLENGLLVTGKIDRLDLLEDGRAVVIDYKYSAAQSVKGKVADATKLQGPLYALASERIFGRTPAAMLYVGLRGPEFKLVGWGEVPGVELKGLLPITPEWIPGALERIELAATHLRAGVIHPLPADTDHCRYCFARDCCRVHEASGAAVIGA